MLVSVAILTAGVLIAEATAASAVGTWSAPSFAGANTSVSCPSASFCLVVDYDANYCTYNGSMWSSGPSFDSGQSVFPSASCPSASFCAAVENEGNAFTYNGSTWSSPSDIDGSISLVSVSCPSASSTPPAPLARRESAPPPRKRQETGPSPPPQAFSLVGGEPTCSRRGKWEGLVPLLPAWVYELFPSRTMHPHKAAGR